MKKSLLLLVLFAIGCSSSDDSNNDNNDDGVSTKLVKREYAQSNFYIEYQYNENDLFSNIAEVLPDSQCFGQQIYVYDANNNMIERRYEYASCQNATTTYVYDSNDRLIEKSSNTSTGTGTTFNYTGNIVEVNRGGSGTTIFLEINSNGLVSKLSNPPTSSESVYSTFDYYNNGNLEVIKTFDYQDNLKWTHNYTYDSKPNPFYGQFESLYLSRFIEMTDDLDYGEAIFYPYGGYDFPYLKNNILSIEKIDESGNSTFTNSTYEYDSDNYPINVFQTAFGDTFEYNIEYFE